MMTDPKFPCMYCNKESCEMNVGLFEGESKTYPTREDWVKKVNEIRKMNPEETCPTRIGYSNLYKALEKAYNLGFSTGHNFGSAGF